MYNEKKEINWITYLCKSVENAHTEHSFSWLKILDFDKCIITYNLK